jgi:hypothetical protein
MRLPELESDIGKRFAQASSVKTTRLSDIDDP